MTLTIEILQCGDVRVDSSFLNKDRNPGVPTIARVSAYLITGGAGGPILVDTGFRATSLMAQVGMTARVPQGCGLEAELASRHVRPADISCIVHTHLHIDHAGKDDLFPLSTPVVVNRRELEIGCGGSGGGGYPAEDMKHLLGRVWSAGAARLLDLVSGDIVEIAPGVAAELANGHTEGSINILVETGDGIARICGDVFYNLEHQVLSPFEETLHREPHISGNTAMSERDERRAMKHALSACTWLLPCHDAPGRLESGRLTGRIVGGIVPGPVVSNEVFSAQHADLTARFAEGHA